MRFHRHRGVFLCSPALACAQDDSQAAPAGTRPIADTPFQLILPSEHLLGDWYGMRSWLEDHGITPTLTFVTDALGNPSGGKQQSVEETKGKTLEQM